MEVIRFIDQTKGCDYSL